MCNVMMMNIFTSLISSTDNYNSLLDVYGGRKFHFNSVFMSVQDSVVFLCEICEFMILNKFPSLLVHTESQIDLENCKSFT